MTANEDWKQYKDTYYWVSNYGKVKHVYKNGNEKYLKPCSCVSGHLQIKGCKCLFSVHRMVAECFIANPENKSCVDHINGVPSDNHLSNLRWATRSENNQNMTKLNRKNTSGCSGVTSNKYKGKHKDWRVTIYVDRQKIHIGMFDEYDDAVNARRVAENTYFGEYAPRHDLNNFIQTVIF